MRLSKIEDVKALADKRKAIDAAYTASLLEGSSVFLRVYDGAGRGHDMDEVIGQHALKRVAADFFTAQLKEIDATLSIFGVDVDG
jgi:hypothetical protein